ncbi:MAG: dienelactone hydrolase family protein [Acidimicrobiales bacterium]
MAATLAPGGSGDERHLAVELAHRLAPLAGARAERPHSVGRRVGRGNEHRPGRNRLATRLSSSKRAGGPMVDVVLFHHVLGRTAGVGAFAEELERGGHRVHAPDLFDGRTFATAEEGMAHAEALGAPDEIVSRGERGVEGLPSAVVYVGLSLGVLPAQYLAQTRPGARGAVLVSACVPPTEFGPSWPTGVAVQVHGMDADPVFAGEGDLEAARALVASTPDAELFLYPGDGHFFVEPGEPSYDADAAAVLTRRVLRFLGRG